MPMDEKALKDLGFDNEQELHHLVTQVDLTNPLMHDAFRKWKADDGTKAGLVSLLQTEKPSQTDYTSEQKKEFPWIVTHTSHTAWRVRDPESHNSEDVLFPNGLHPPRHAIAACFTCGAAMGLTGVLARRWSVQERSF